MAPLVSPTTLLQHLSLSISKYAELGSRSCNRNDQNAAGSDCKFIEGEEAIAQVSYPTSVFSTAAAGIQPGQLNIDILV